MQSVTADHEKFEQMARQLARLPTRFARGAMVGVLKTQYGTTAAWQIRERALYLRRQGVKGPAAPRAPVARNSDPRSSHEAAAEKQARGTRTGNMQIVAKAVACHPGHTSRELHAYGYCEPLDLHEVGRRMSDAAEINLVVKGEQRKCAFGNRKATAFWPPVRQGVK